MTIKTDVTKLFTQQFNLYYAKYHDRDLAYRKALQYIEIHRGEYNLLSAGC